jgi:hypothetical protein
MAQSVAVSDVQNENNEEACPKEEAGEYNSYF